MSYTRRLTTAVQRTAAESGSAGSARHDLRMGRDEERSYRGAMRMAPSRRMVSPLSIGFSTMCTARCAVFAGIAEARRMRHLGAEALAGFLVQIPSAAASGTGRAQWC